MSRQTRREEERKANKLRSWVKGWDLEQKNFFDAMVNSEIKVKVSKEVDKVQEVTEKILDSCYIAAMLDNLDIEIIDTIKIAKEANSYMDSTRKYLEEEGENYFMKINNEELRLEIRTVAKEMLKEGQVMSRGVSELKKTYNLPVKDLSIIWAEAKEEFKKEPIKCNIATEKEKEEFLKSLPKGESKKSKKTELPYVVTEKEIEVARSEATLTIEEAAKLEMVKAEFKAPTELKIKSIEIEGKYGTYLKTEKGITTEQIFVKDIKDLEEYKKAVEGEYNKGKDKLDKRLKELQEEKNKLDERANKNFAIIEEIEQVFNL